MATPKIEVEIGAKISQLTKALTDAEGKLQTFGRQATALGKTLSLAVTAPILAIGAAAVKSASDTEEAFSKFDTVFRDVAKSADESFKTLRNEFGLSSLEAKSLLASTGDLLTGFGFTQSAALDLSTEVNKLAVDLASFTNFSGGAEGASKALTSALLGEREAVKSLEISILEEDVKKRVAINTAQELTFESERQAKAFATLQIAQEQSANAIGDYARTSDSFANQTRLLRARISDLASEFGEVLLPLATRITTAVTGLINGFTGLDRQTKTIIVSVAAFAAAIGPLSLALGAVIQSLPLITAGFAALAGPIGIAVTALVGAAALIIANWDQVVFKVKTGLLEVVNAALQAAKFINVLASAFPGFVATSTAAVAALKQLGAEISESIINNIGGGAVTAVDGLKDSIKELISPETQTGIRGVAKALSSVQTVAPSNNFATLPTVNAPSISNRNTENRSFFQKLADEIDSFAPSIIDKLKNFAFAVDDILRNSIGNAFLDLGNSIGEAIAKGGNVIQAVGQSLLKSIGNFLGQLGQQLIAFGIAGLNFGKLSLALTNPFTAIKAAPLAIAAGVALTAAAGAIGQIGQRGIGGSSGVGVGVSGVGGGQAQSFTGGGLENAFLGGLDVSGQIEVDGTKLLVIIENALKKQNRG